MERVILRGNADYPISVEPSSDRVVVTFAGHIVAQTDRSLVLAEGEHPATRYIPIEDVDLGALRASQKRGYSPYKGEASYFDVSLGGATIENAAWTYESPHEDVGGLQGHVAFGTGESASVKIRIE